MTAVLVALVVVATVALVLLVVTGRRNARTRERQRVEALARLGERIDAVLAPLRRSPVELPAPPVRPSAATAPVVADRLPGRAAFVDAVTAAVAAARASEGRLAAAFVVASGDTTSAELADCVRHHADAPVYAVGPSSVAVALPGLGRADALGVLARVEAAVASTGRAVELGPDEDAVELVARLLSAAG